MPDRVSAVGSQIPVIRIGASQGFIIDFVLAKYDDAVRIAAALGKTLDTTAKTDLRIREIAAGQLGENGSRPDRIEYYFGTTLDEDLDPVADVILAVSTQRIGVIDLGVFTGDAEDDDVADVQDIEDMVWGRVGLPPGTTLPFTAAGLVPKRSQALTLVLGFDDGERWAIRMAEPTTGRSAPKFYAGLLQPLDRVIAAK